MEGTEFAGFFLEVDDSADLLYGIILEVAPLTHKLFYDTSTSDSATRLGIQKMQSGTANTYLFLIPLAIGAMVAVQTYRQHRASMNSRLGVLAYCITIAGLLGFFGAFWLPLFPSELDRFEFPNDPIEGVRLTAPDGRVFMTSRPYGRVQRYGPGGFEKGFGYSGKASKFGMSSSGNILVCTTSGALLTYSPDGKELLPRLRCANGSEFSSPSYPSHAQVPTIAFNPFSRLAVPLWHPLTGWLTAGLGFLLLKLSSVLTRRRFEARSRRNGSVAY